ncbi:MAG TPA: aldo/keto reductase [Terriglobales bacterium]|nr:aldo/keto reductase [Terriglobales bacterium]
MDPRRCRTRRDILCANQAVVGLLARVAQEKKATPAQVALAWLLAQKPSIVPIPGTTKLHRLGENLGTIDVKLSQEDFRQPEAAAANMPAQGARYSQELQRMVGR